MRAFCLISVFAFLGCTGGGAPPSPPAPGIHPEGATASSGPEIRITYTVVADSIGEDRELEAEGGDPHALTMERDLLGQLEEAVRKLPPMQRDVFLMRAQQGAEYGEIADALETSIGAARVHYHQAVKRLKAILR